MASGNGRNVGGTGAARQPSLSFETQEAFRLVIQQLVSSTEDITIFCGAGTSVDSGLPTWVQLLQRLAMNIKSDAVRKLVTNEPDIKRAAQFILDQQMNELSTTHKIASALYEDASSSPGQLATAVAALCARLGRRARVITTNYDDRLELALIRELGGVSNISVFGLDEAEAWLSDSNTLPILHVHGFIPSQQLSATLSTKSPVVLTEGDYLQSGSKVQKIIHERLSSSHMIFIGASMADSSVVFPLSSTYAPGDIKTPTALLVPDVGAAARATSNNVDSLAQTHLTEFAKYLNRALRTNVIELKSFGQVAQCIAELTAALETGDQYLSDDHATSSRYGHRFKRIVTEVHARVGIQDGESPPGGDQSRKFSDRLDEALKAVDGPVPLIERFRLSRDYDLLQTDESYFKNENFALSIWLRTLRPAPGIPRYEIVLAGSSDLSPRDGRAMAQRAAISPLSRFPASRAIYRGGAFRESLDDNSSVDDHDRGWLTHLAVPLVVTEAQIGLPQTSQQGATVGAVVLHSDRRHADWDQHRKDVRPLSILSLMELSTDLDLISAIMTAGLAAIEQ